MRGINLFGRSSAPAVEAAAPVVEATVPAADVAAEAPSPAPQSVSLLTMAATGPLAPFGTTESTSTPTAAQWRRNNWNEISNQPEWELVAKSIELGDLEHSWTLLWWTQDAVAVRILDACQTLEGAFADALETGVIDEDERAAARVSAAAAFPAIAADLEVIAGLRAGIDELDGVDSELADDTVRQLRRTLDMLLGAGSIASFTAFASEEWNRLAALSGQVRLAREQELADALAAQQEKTVSDVATRAMFLTDAARGRVQAAAALSPLGVPEV